MNQIWDEIIPANEEKRWNASEQSTARAKRLKEKKMQWKNFLHFKMHLVEITMKM